MGRRRQRIWPSRRTSRRTPAHERVDSRDKARRSCRSRWSGGGVARLRHRCSSVGARRSRAFPMRFRDGSTVGRSWRSAPLVATFRIYDPAPRTSWATSCCTRRSTRQPDLAQHLPQLRVSAPLSQAARRSRSHARDRYRRIMPRLPSLSSLYVTFATRAGAIGKRAGRWRKRLVLPSVTRPRPRAVCHLSS